MSKCDLPSQSCRRKLQNGSLGNWFSANFIEIHDILNFEAFLFKFFTISTDDSLQLLGNIYMNHDAVWPKHESFPKSPKIITNCGISFLTIYHHTPFYYLQVKLQVNKWKYKIGINKWLRRIIKTELSLNSYEIFITQQIELLALTSPHESIKSDSIFVTNHWPSSVAKPISKRSNWLMCREKLEMSGFIAFPKRCKSSIVKFISNHFRKSTHRNIQSDPTWKHPTCKRNLVLQKPCYKQIEIFLWQRG